MSLEVKRTKHLINPNDQWMDILLYGLPGAGKTKWSATAPTPGYASCEAGEGGGLKTVAQYDFPYVEPRSIGDFEVFCSTAPKVFPDCETIVLDSLSDMAKTFIKDYALTFPRKLGNTMKRAAGVPELDDYGTMGEVTRRLVRKLKETRGKKHLIVIATERYDKPDPELPGTELLIGPDLPGQLFLGSTAIFNYVFRLRTRQVGSGKNAEQKRYLITDQSGYSLAKCRSIIDNKPLLPLEIEVNLDTGEGTFPDVLNRIKKAYLAYAERNGATAPSK